MAIKPLPPADVLRKLLDYNLETGELYWKPRPASMFQGLKHSPERCANAWNTKYAGMPAFDSIRRDDGYHKGAFEGRVYTKHRIIWKMATGVDPQEIDHIDGNRSNNGIGNLREVDRRQNTCNRRRPTNNRSGVIGVYFDPNTGLWRAKIAYRGMVERLGSFPTIEAAAEARRDAEIRYGFHPNHGRDG